MGELPATQIRDQLRIIVLRQNLNLNRGVVLQHGESSVQKFAMVDRVQGEIHGESTRDPHVDWFGKVGNFYRMS